MSKSCTVLFNTALISVLSIAVGCSKTEKTSSSTFSTVKAAQLSAEGNINEASEMYARIGELLLATPEGTLHADTMFQKSLELDVKNNKANLYSAILSPVLSAKGFVTRFKVLNENDKIEQEKMNKLEEKIKASGVKEFVDFALVLPKGKTVAKNLEDVRKFYRHEYTNALAKSLVKLDNIASKRFELDLNISAYNKYKNDDVTSCESVADGQIECDDSSMTSGRKERLRLNVDQFDLKALKIIIKTQKIAFTIAYSMGLEGFENVSEKLKKLNSPTDRDIVRIIQTEPNLLKIDGDKEDLKEIFSHSEEVMNDLIDFSKISNEICNVEDRRSNLAQNICVSEEAAEKINEILMYVVGPKSLVLGRDSEDREISVEVNLRALVDSNITSIQELLPNKFDQTGKAIEVKDPTFGGVIPNGDLISKLKLLRK